MASILCDTGFWIALFTHKDAAHEDAYHFYERHNTDIFLIPYPSIYEFLGTTFCANKFKSFHEEVTKKKQLNLVEFKLDDKYRTDLLEKIYVRVSQGKEASSVDVILMNMMDDLPGCIFITCDGYLHNYALARVKDSVLLPH